MDYDLRAEGDKLPAEQLAMEWNEMERKIQDDKFWYFISEMITRVPNSYRCVVLTLSLVVGKRMIQTIRIVSFRNFMISAVIKNVIEPMKCL